MDKVVKQKKKKPLCLPKLQYDKNSQDVELIAGMPIIARVNANKYDIFNNEMFIITTITDDSIFFKEEDNKQVFNIPSNLFQKSFYVAYCITVHKSQGSTFNNPYTIHEFNKFDNRLKYVALSRSTDIKNINIT